MTTGVHPASGKKSVTERLHLSTQVVLLGVVGVEAALFAVLIPEFLTTTNLLNAARATSYLAILSIGVTFGLISGAIDLSVGSVLAISGVMGHVMITAGLPGPIAAAVAIVTGVLFGFLNGVITVRFRVHSLITTLGMLSVARGLAFVIADDLAPPSRDAFFNMFQNRLLGVPLTVLLAIAIFIVGYFVLAHTRFGQYAYAIGDNGAAARDAALPVDRLRIKYLIVSGALAGLAGWVLASTIGIGYKGAGAGYELTVITAVLLGGVGFTGGSGSMVGTLIAIVLMGILTNGMNLYGLNSSYQAIVIGAMLLVALGLQARRSGGFR